MSEFPVTFRPVSRLIFEFIWRKRFRRVPVGKNSCLTQKFYFGKSNISILFLKLTLLKISDFDRRIPNLESELFTLLESPDRTFSNYIFRTFCAEWKNVENKPWTTCLRACEQFELVEDFLSVLWVLHFQARIRVKWEE